MRFQKSWVLASVIISGLFCFTSMAGAEASVLFEVSGASAISNVYGGYSGSVVIKISQKYVAPENQTVCKVYHKVAKVGAPTDNFVLNLRRGGSDGDGGVLIATVSLPGASLPDTSPSVYTIFSLPTCVPLSSGETYWFTFEPSQPTPFGSYRSAYRVSDEFSYSSAWNRNGFAFNQPGWHESAAEWSLKLEGEDKPKLTPVLVIPGILGTELSQGNDLIWPDLGQMLGDIGDEFIPATLGLDSSGESINQISADKPVEVILNSLPDFRVDTFKGLRTVFEQKGYVLNLNFFYFPYDWRLDLDKTKDLLKMKIDEIKVSTGLPKVDIIAHSMGGLLVKDYIAEYGKANINKLIFVGTPHLGAPKAGKTLLLGERFDIPWLAESAMKALALNTPSVYELLPSPTYFSQFTGYLRGAEDGGALDYSHTKDFLVSHGVNWNLLDKADAFFNQNLATLDLGGVDTYNIAGCESPTQAGYQYVPGNSEVANIKYASGDKTVPLPSADYISIPSDHKYYLKDATHASLPSAASVRDVIMGILSGASSVPLGADMARGDTAICNFKGKELLWRSPVEIHVYDQLGNHTGPIENNAIEYGVPGVDYEIIGHRKFIFLPTDGSQQYRVVTEGLEDGTFDLLVNEEENGQSTKTTVFNDVKITPRSTAELNVSQQSQDGELSLDEGGTGQFISVAAASVVSGSEAIEDNTPPSTAIDVIATRGENNWYTSNAVVRFSAIDDKSGVLVTRYAVGDSDFSDYNAPLTISDEGTTTIRYFSIDNAGNNEPVKIEEVRIDKTSPEFSVQFSADKDDFIFTATDNLGGQLTPICGAGECIAKDLAGNAAKIDYLQKKDRRGDSYQLKLLRLSYDDVASALPVNIFSVEFREKSGTIRDFNQSVLIRGQERGRVEYRRKTNQSVISLREKNNKPTVQKVAGLTFLNLFTQKGMLDINIK